MILAVLAQAAAPEIRDIEPPLPILPYPLWMIIAAAVAALALLSLVVSVIARWLARRPAPPPPDARTQALAALQELRSEVETAEPYEFSIRVSDVLRGYISAKYPVPATRQTSQEFLASVARSTHFSEPEKQLLEPFLEHCDMIKFARVHATSEDNRQLLDQASAFITGGGAR